MCRFICVGFTAVVHVKRKKVEERLVTALLAAWLATLVSAAALLEATTAVLLTLAAIILAVHALADDVIEHSLGLIDAFLRSGERARSLEASVALRRDSDLAAGLQLQTLDLFATTSND